MRVVVRGDAGRVLDDALVPGPISWTTVILGGQQWILAVGFFASAVLLGRLARVLRREDLADDA